LRFQVSKAREHPILRQSHIAVVERNVWWDGHFETEPYEAGWASEALGFLHIIEAADAGATIDLRVQISADGIHWADEGSGISEPIEAGLHYVRISHFGTWLRVTGTTQGRIKIIFSWSLK
jgi:hypothetical protein